MSQHLVTDLPPEAVSFHTLLWLWRQHGEIEKKYHWVLDAVFDEDRSTARKGAPPMVLTLLRQAVITLLRFSG